MSGYLSPSSAAGKTVSRNACDPSLQSSLETSSPADSRGAKSRRFPCASAAGCPAASGSPETSSAGPAPKASRSALSASSAPGRHPYRSIPQRCSSSCFSLRYGSASLRLRGGTEATAHVSASMNQDVSLRLGSAVKTKTPGFPYHSATHTVAKALRFARRLSGGRSPPAYARAFLQNCTHLLVSTTASEPSGI